MGRDILKYGVIAGLVVAAGMWGTLLAFGDEMPHSMLGMALGYLTMLVALGASLLFTAAAGPVIGSVLMQLTLMVITAMFFTSQYFSYLDCFVEARESGIEV